MLVIGKRLAEFFLFHQGEGKAIGEAYFLIGIFFKKLQGPALTSGIRAQDFKNTGG